MSSVDYKCGSGAQAAHRDLVAALWSGGRTAIRRIPYHPIHAHRFSPEIRKILSIEADKVDPRGYAFLLQEAIPRLSVLTGWQNCGSRPSW